MLSINNMRIRHSPQPISEEDTLKIAKAILESKEYMDTSLGNFLRLRDCYAWLIINALGLRPKECLSLRWVDIDFKARKVRLSPYWNKQRVDIPAVLTKPAMELILEYEQKLNEIGFSSPYLFPSSLTLDPLSTSNYAKRFLRAAKEAGVAKIVWKTDAGQPKYNIRPYTGRHNFCTKIWKATHSEIAVMKLARHLNQESAQFYVHLDDKDKISLADDIF